MPRFQPGQSRYFGATARPTSSITGSILPLFRGARAPGELRRPLRAMKPQAYTIGKTERQDITKKLLKMPHYIPAETTKKLKVFAKRVMADKKAFSKEERVFAQETLQKEHVIKNEEAQKKFIEGEVEALVGVQERRVKDPFRFVHHSEEVAGQTLRGLVKERRDQESKPSVSDRRASIKSNRDMPVAPTEAPAPTWTAPAPLGEAAGTDQPTESTGAGWSAPFMPAHHSPVAADAVHAPTLPALGSISAGGSADVLILSDHLSDPDVSTWSKNLNLRLRRLPLTTGPLVHAFPNIPPTVIVEAQAGVPLTSLKLPPTVQRVIIFAKPGVDVTPLIEGQEREHIVAEELSEASLRTVLDVATGGAKKVEETA